MSMRFVIQQAVRQVLIKGLKDPVIPPLERLPVNCSCRPERGELQREFRDLVKRQPELMRELQAYGWHHVRPRPFLVALLANDLLDALNLASVEPGRPDHVHSLALYVINHLPPYSYGNRAMVEAWCAVETSAAMVERVKGAQQT